MMFKYLLKDGFAWSMMHPISQDFSDRRVKDRLD